MANKVKFNLKNVHYAKIKDTDGTITYEKPVPIPGAVSISLDAQGDTSSFYADGIVYYQTSANSGYSGDLVIAKVPESFLKDILGETVKENVLVENVNAKQEAFAFLFEFDGDVNEVRYVLYNCKATRPSITSQTNENSVEVRTDTLTLTAVPRADGIVKAKCEDTEATSYDTWFTSVFDPTA